MIEQKRNKQVLVVSSSPRKGGNSDLLCDQFVAGAADAGHQAEKIFLRERKIHFCTGCGICFEKKRCSQNDDMAGILDKMIAAEVIVLASPVYFYTMCGQMKVFIDRTCARYTEISDKEFYFIITAAVRNKALMERTIEAFRGFTSCLNGPREKGIIYGAGAWEKGDILKSSALKQAYKMGRES